MEDLSLPTIQLPAGVINNVSPDVLSIAAGCFAFGSTLALSTLAQGRIMRLSTGSVRPLPTLGGMVSVGLAALASHQSSIMTHRAATTKNGSARRLGKSNRGRHDEVSIGEFNVSKHTLRM